MKKIERPAEKNGNKQAGIIAFGYRTLSVGLIAFIAAAAGLSISACGFSKNAESTPNDTLSATQKSEPTATPYATPTAEPTEIPTVTPSPTATPNEEETLRRLLPDLELYDAPIFSSSTLVVDYTVNGNRYSIPCAWYGTKRKTVILAYLFACDSRTEVYIYVFETTWDEIDSIIEDDKKPDESLYKTLAEKYEGQDVKVIDVYPLFLSEGRLADRRIYTRDSKYHDAVGSPGGFMLTEDFARYWVETYEYSELVFPEYLLNSENILIETPSVEGTLAPNETPHGK